MKGSASAVAIILTALAGSIGLCAPAPAATRVALTPNYDYPGATIQVRGSHFGANEPVDVYFDTTDEYLAATNDKGALPKHKFTVPASTLPGEHWITAIGRNTGLAAQAELTVSTDWPTFHFENDRSGNNTYENILSSSNVSNLGSYWGDVIGSDIESSPVVANGTVFVGSTDNNIYALDASTGALRWSATTGNVIESSPAVANKVVYVGSGDTSLYALDASSGALLWKSSVFASIEASPAVANGTVYISSVGGGLWAFDASNGTELWQAGEDTTPLTSPAVANGVVYVGSSDNNLYAFNAATGAFLWQAATSGRIDATPVISDGQVFVASTDNSLYAFNASTGHLYWSFATGGPIRVTPVVSNGYIWFGSDDGYLYAVSTCCGAQLLKASRYGTIGSLSAANGLVFVGIDQDGASGVVDIFDATSGELGALATAAIGNSSPAISNGVVYVGSANNQGSNFLYAFALNGGNDEVYRKHRAAPDTRALAPDWRLKVSN